MADGFSRRTMLGVAGVAPALAAGALAASENVPRVPPMGNGQETAPFVEHHLALQLSDRDAHKQALIISIANNLLKVYGPDLIAIEVVAFGPGIDLLLADSSKRQAVDSLIAQGVRFDVCMNTVETIARESGHTPLLNDKAIPVEAGVAQILKLAEGGYTLVRP